MNRLRSVLARSAYLVALATGMVGWVWVLLTGVGWALGV
jgi:hypothetical protein